MKLAIFWVFLCIGGTTFAEDELMSVVVLFRHGARAPMMSYPKDPHQNSTLWRSGFGELTNEGKNVAYNLGVWLRRRYNSFLPDIYHQKDIYIRSTNIDRALMSAYLVLAGLYYPKQEDTWNENIAWQPIPVHTVDDDADSFLMKAPCPKNDRLQEELLGNPSFQSVHAKNHNMYKFVEAHTEKTIETLDNVKEVYDTLLVEEYYNLTLPEWSREVYPDKLQPIANLVFELPTYTSDMTRLTVGPFFYKLTEYLLNENERKNPMTSNVPEKMLMLSAHDSTIANVLRALSNYDDKIPPFSGALIFELRRGKENAAYVNILYKNSTTPAEITLPGCDFNCDLGKFVKILKPITVPPKQWMKECHEKV